MYPKPRKCSKRYLDADCPKEILCLFRGVTKTSFSDGKETEDLTIIYDEVQQTEHPSQYYLFMDVFDSGDVLQEHTDLTLGAVQTFRYRFKHRYCSWSSLDPHTQKAVKDRIKEAGFTPENYEAVAA